MTTRLAWVTDIHLNFLAEKDIVVFCQGIVSVGAEALIISGDIAEGPTLKGYLETLERELERPIYFVLGNHDYYRSSIPRVRKNVAALCEASKFLRWLPLDGVIELGPKTGLVGHDGWADGRLGDYSASTVLLNDYMLIDELSGLSSKARLIQLNALGDEVASFAQVYVSSAMERFDQVFFITHVPPFAEACWYEGQISADHWLPHFACGAAGSALIQIAKAHPESELTVLCGHTHSRGVARILPNLLVRTGAAVYGTPVIEEVIDVPDRL